MTTSGGEDGRGRQAEGYAIRCSGFKYVNEGMGRVCCVAVDGVSGIDRVQMVYGSDVASMQCAVDGELFTRRICICRPRQEKPYASADEWV